MALSKKQEFLEFIDALMVAAPDVAANMSDNVQMYIDSLKGVDADKPMFTENGKLILQYMRDHLDVEMWKARDLADGMLINSRGVSGSIRKLVSDGFVDKVGQDPVLYAITEKGKTVEII